MFQVQFSPLLRQTVQKANSLSLSVFFTISTRSGHFTNLFEFILSFSSTSPTWKFLLFCLSFSLSLSNVSKTQPPLLFSFPSNFSMFEHLHTFSHPPVLLCLTTPVTMYDHFQMGAIFNCCEFHHFLPFNTLFFNTLFYRPSSFSTAQSIR